MIHVDVLLIVFSPLMDHTKSSILPSTKYGIKCPMKGFSDLTFLAQTPNSLPFVEEASAWGNISFLGAMHHGKTTFMDLLVLNTHEKDWKVGKEIRLLPFRKVVRFWGLGERNRKNGGWVRKRDSQTRVTVKWRTRKDMVLLGLDGFDFDWFSCAVMSMYVYVHVGCYCRIQDNCDWSFHSISRIFTSDRLIQTMKHSDIVEIYYGVGQGTKRKLLVI